MRDPAFGCDCHWRQPGKSGTLNTQPRLYCNGIRKDNPAKSSRNPNGVPDHSPGLRRIGATPARRICLKPSPERAAQTPGMSGLCATLSGLLPAGVPTRGRREARQPRAVLRSPFRAPPSGNPQVWDFLPAHHPGNHLLSTRPSAFLTALPFFL